MVLQLLGPFLCMSLFRETIDTWSAVTTCKMPIHFQEHVVPNRDQTVCPAGSIINTKNLLPGSAGVCFARQFYACFDESSGDNRYALMRDSLCLFFVYGVRVPDVCKCERRRRSPRAPLAPGSPREAQPPRRAPTAPISCALRARRTNDGRWQVGVRQS